ncbi:MAG: TIM barrel protein [Chloroflexi bacterium]|nr:TIM barrel protein [Chloroflexota bacterium]
MNPLSFMSANFVARQVNYNMTEGWAQGDRATNDYFRPLETYADKAYGVRLGIENHPEKTPQELLEKIGDGADGFIGAAVDTGWFGTQGFDAMFALIELRNHLVYIHLKDVLAPGAHVTCRYGQGCVPIQRCVEMLQRLDYDGPISIEHEPEHADPTEDVRASARILRRWLATPP